MRKINKAKTVCGLIILLVFFTNCFATKNKESLIYVQVHLNENYIKLNEGVLKYEEIWIGYRVTNITFINVFGEECFVIEKAYYFYKDKDEYILLGSVDKTGLYDKNEECLKPVPAIPPDYIIVGISSSLVTEQNIFGPSLILKSRDKENSFIETEAFVLVDFDTQNDTIKLMEY